MRTLDHVRWLGGGSGAGKTTVTRVLAERFDLRIYSSDEMIEAHSARLTAAAAPLLDGFRCMSMDERWVRRDPVAMYETFPWFHGEGLDLLVEDLRNLSEERIVLAEGFRLLPHLVRPHLSNPRHAVWLIPTPAFRRAALLRRDGTGQFWLRTTDPKHALSNLLERDRIFTDTIAAAAAGSGLPTLTVDGTRGLDELVEDLTNRFELRR